MFDFGSVKLNADHFLFADDVARNRESINLLKNIIKQKEQEIVFLRSSKFWKLRGWYLKIKFALFSPIKFLENI